MTGHRKAGVTAAGSVEKAAAVATAVATATAAAVAMGCTLRHPGLEDAVALETAAKVMAAVVKALVVLETVAAVKAGVAVEMAAAVMAAVVLETAAAVTVAVGTEMAAVVKAVVAVEMAGKVMAAVVLETAAAVTVAVVSETEAAVKAADWVAVAVVQAAVSSDSAEVVAQSHRIQSRRLSSRSAPRLYRCELHRQSCLQSMYPTKADWLGANSHSLACQPLYKK